MRCPRVLYGRGLGADGRGVSPDGRALGADGRALGAPERSTPSHTRRFRKRNDFEKSAGASALPRATRFDTVYIENVSALRAPIF